MSDNRLAIRELSSSVLIFGALSGICADRIAQVSRGGFGERHSIAIR